MSEAQVRQAFRDQAAACLRLGSRFTASLCEMLADRLHHRHGPVAEAVLGWQGDPSGRADSLPLRLCGGLHALVLSGADASLADSYLTRRLDESAVLEALAAQEAMLLDWLGSPPQTNEVARSATIIAAARFLAMLAPRPIRALELGASAGLNLNFARYTLNCPSGAPCPPRDADQPPRLVLAPDWQGDPPKGEIHVASARGVDLRPVDARTDALRLLAYCWPDQPTRMARLRTALEIARTHPPRVEAGDAADWLAARLSRHAPGQLTLVYHTIAAQYFPSSTLAACEATLATAGAAASRDTPLAHFAMESDGGDGAALTLRLWDGTGAPRHWRLGRADFHGRWVRWQPEAG